MRGILSDFGPGLLDRRSEPLGVDTESKFIRSNLRDAKVFAGFQLDLKLALDFLRHRDRDVVNA